MAVRAAMAVAEEEVSLLLSLPESLGDAIATTARIAWKDDAGKLAGLQFVDLPLPIRKRIRTWIAGHSSLEFNGEAEAAKCAEDYVASELASKSAATVQPDSEPMAQTELTVPASLVPAHGPPARELAANEPRSRRSRVVNSIPRLLVLIGVIAVSAFIAGWAMGLRVLSHEADSSTAKSDVSKDSSALSQLKQPPAPKQSAALTQLAPPALNEPRQAVSPNNPEWIFLGHLTPEFTWSEDSVKTIGGTWPIKKGDRVSITHDVWARDGSRSSAQIVGRFNAGETVSVDEVSLLHGSVGGNFVWAEVSATPSKP